MHAWIGGVTWLSSAILNKEIGLFFGDDASFCVCVYIY